jgi:NAD(P)H-nitrite reductase large subunit
MKHVIIGNGVAGTVAAETLRRLDPESQILIVSDEASPPYCRPMISMLLEGRVSEKALPIRGEGFYEELGITPVLGSRISRLDPDRKTLETGDGRVLSYDRLLIASGADPRPIKAENQELENIFYMRTRAQVQEMIRSLRGAKNALVLGGGLVGFKAAYGLLRRGIRVTMLIRSGYPLSFQVDETAGRMIQETLEKQGLEVRVGAEVKAFEGVRQVRGARLKDGGKVACELVVIGKGVFPAHGFVPRDKIDVDAGIVVNGRMQTSAPDVFAAGDVAEYIDIARKRPWVNAIWPEAVTQGEAAAMNMAGRSLAYKGSLSRNVIRIFDLDVMTAGLVNPPADDPDIEALSEADPRRDLYRKLVFRGDVLAGFAMVNRIEQGGILASLVRSELPVQGDKHRLLRPDFNFAKLAPGGAARSRF